jgi:enamine deaminase RidA (YjgF/YER057c/UK114 family)
MSIARIQPGTRMSQAVVHGGTIYLAGQVASDPAAGIEDQTRQVLAKIDALLESTGSNKSKLLFANVWLAEIASYDAMNTIWDAWIKGYEPPARACVESKLAAPGYKVEIAVVAAK